MFQIPVPQTVTTPVLNTVWLVVDGGAPALAVEYRYGSSGGLLAGVRWGEDGGRGGEAYPGDYDGGAWFVQRNGVQTTRHVTRAPATEDYTAGDVRALQHNATTVLSDGGGEVQSWTSSGTVTASYSVRSLSVALKATGGAPSHVVASRTESCSAGNCSTSTFANRWTWDTVGGVARVTSELNSRDASTDWQYTLNSDAGEWEVSSLRRADTFTGESTEARTYFYGVDGQQFPASVTRASVLAAGQSTHTVYRRDSATSRLEAAFHVGYRRTWNESTGVWSDVQATRATFYFSNYKCTGGGADSLGRTVEMHGPCWVADTSATDCPGTDAFAVTQWRPAGGGKWLGEEAVWPATTSATSCTGAELVRTASAFDAFGYPHAMVGSNGETTSMTYVDGRLATSTTADGTTSYGYDNEELTRVTYPEGNHEVFCYRNVALGQPCDGSAAWFGRLKWKARAPNADGTGYTEAETYTYYADGRLQKLETWTGASEKRAVRTFDHDKDGRVAALTLGEGTGAVWLPRRWDTEGNISGVGDRTGGARCTAPEGSGIASLNSACGSINHDGFGRLLSLDRRFTAIRDCFTSDNNGNPTSRQAGCAATTANPLCTGCTRPLTNWVWDDFGNVVEFAPAGGGVTRMAHDVRGGVTVRQTPSMVANQEALYATFDGLGRELTFQHRWALPTAGAETLRSSEYDVGAAPAAGCPAIANTKGRLRARGDSFGQTWFSYDAAGRLVLEARLRSGVASCVGARPRDVPHTGYSYTANGLLASVSYPLGRVVTYGYGTSGGKTTGRVSTVTVKKRDAGSWVDWEALTKVAWEPYSEEVRAWEATPFDGMSSAWAAEYMLGVPAEPTATCPRSKPTTHDGSGRVGMLWVSSGGLTLGGGSGELFHRVFRYGGNSLDIAREETCWLGSTQQHEIVNYGYDNPGRVTSNDTSGVVSETFGYDANNNRTSAVSTLSGHSGFTENSTYFDGGLVDRLAKVTHRNGWETRYAYDVDGRTVVKEASVDSSGQPAFREEWSPAALGVDGRGGTDTVYRAVSVNGVVYGYYYDGNNRRRLKEYPTGARDEYFYGAGGQMLVDVGNDSLVAPGFAAVDEYVWLGNRPVVVMRSKLALADDARSDDDDGTCGRSGASTTCGGRHLVTDRLPKVVAVMDVQGKVASRLDYNAFGQVNFVKHNIASSNPYGNSLNQTLWSGALGNKGGAGAQMETRWKLWVDTEGTPGAPVDKVTSSDVADIGGYHLGRVAGQWRQWDGGWVTMRLQSNATNCGPGGCDGGVSWPYAGVRIEGMEYRRKQSGAEYFEVPLRFPGQYFDAETGMNENHNRYYDSSTGRYLSSEPLLQAPEYVSAMARGGYSVPTYAYALNNPLRWTDSTGLKPGDKFKTPDEAAKDALEWLRKNRKRKQLRDYEWCGQIRKTADNQCVADMPKRGPLVKPGDSRAVCDVGPMTPNSMGDFHNHPWTSEFSDPDINMNRERMYSGYLLGPDGNIMKFTPTIVPGLVPTVDRSIKTIEQLGSVEPY